MAGKSILLIEDDYLDVESVKRELSKLKTSHNLVVAHNGSDALNILTSKDALEKRSLPDIILLDLNMPKMNGFEFLRIIKNYYSLKDIKVFIMSTSAEDYDKILTENLGAVGYIVKPLNFSPKAKVSDSTTLLRTELE
jgi:CheY-like chemotaxis protein